MCSAVPDEYICAFFNERLTISAAKVASVVYLLVSDSGFLKSEWGSNLES